MNAINNDSLLSAIDEAAMEVRLGIELAKQAQERRSDSDDMAQCSLAYIEKHLLNAQAALRAAGAN